MGLAPLAVPERQVEAAFVSLARGSKPTRFAPCVLPSKDRVEAQGPGSGLSNSSGSFYLV